MSEENQTLNESDVKAVGDKLAELRSTLNQVLYGQERLIDFVLIGILARGHILLEGLPGLGKTELVKGLSGALGLDAKRIQFTPDLLPGDITGNPMLQESEGQRQFVFQQGPIFANLVLADEINRASPKTQAALLEAMAERSVTVMGDSHSLPNPFFVFATQNPIELEGTYPLPEAQVDRFLMKLQVTRNDVHVLEKIISTRNIGISPTVTSTIDQATLLSFIEMSSRVYLPPVVVNYIARLVDGSHPGQSKASAGVKYGTSPRAAIGMATAARAKALLDGRNHAGFEDVQAIAAPVMAHRIVLDYQAKLEGDTGASIVEKLLEEITPQDRELPSSLKAAKI